MKVVKKRKGGKENMKSELKIAYLCEHSPKNKYAHSGGNTRIYNQLANKFTTVDIIENDWGKLRFLDKLIHKLPFSMLIRLRFRIHLMFAGLINRQVAKQLKNKKYDVLFCSYSFFCLSKLKLPYPIKVAFTSDASYTAYKFSSVGEKFGSYFSLSRVLDKWILAREIEVYKSVDYLLWPSQWIKESSERLYGISSAQSKLVPWGANIEDPGLENIVIENSLDDGISLLFVGRDWYPKGGPVTYEVFKRLKSDGYNVRLTIVGCNPPEAFSDKDIIVYPQLDKEKPDELSIFKNAYKHAHFFVMPSVEAYGFAFCEASAYGLPSLCLKVGGVPVENNLNGFAFIDTSTDQYVEKIKYYYNNQSEYYCLRKNTREYYEKQLNWDVWVDRCCEIITS